MSMSQNPSTLTDEQIAQIKRELAKRILIFAGVKLSVILAIRYALKAVENSDD